MERRPKFNISDILEAAAAENDRQLMTEYTPPEREEPEKSPDPEPAPPEDAPVGCETDELIGKYSRKPAVVDKKTSTDSLRESLADSMANDKELLSYYRTLAGRKKSRKVEELYNLINFATENDLKERSELETVKPDSHFTESDGKER